MYFFYYMPVGIDRRIHRFPFLTVFYSALCVLIFIGNHFLSGRLPIDFYNFIYIPGNSPMLSAVTAAFLHFGYMHLIGNIIYLVLFGRYVEDRMGPVAFTFIFMSSAFVGNYVQGYYNIHVFHQYYVGIIGASGAISGILAVFAVRFMMSRLRIAYWVFMPLQAYTRAGFVEIPAIFAVILWFILQAAQGLVELGGAGGNVAYITHLSSFVWGLLMAALFGQLEKGRAEVLLRRAEEAVKKSDFFGAQAQYRKYVDKCPGDGEALASLARCQLLCGSKREARLSYRSACEIMLGTGKRGDAEAVFSQALRGFDDMVLHTGPHMDLAFGLERDLKPGLALKAYSNFAAAYPDHPEAPFALLRTANLHWNTFADGPQAKECYGMLLKKYPEDIWIDFAREQIRLLAVSGTA